MKGEYSTDKYWVEYRSNPFNAPKFPFIIREQETNKAVDKAKKLDEAISKIQELENKI